MLITGIAGSGGSYLAEHIAQEHPGVEIHGIARVQGVGGRPNLDAVRDRVRVHDCDLTDAGAALAVLGAVRPDAVFHLASRADVRASFDAPTAFLENNVLGTANLLEAVRRCGAEPVLQMCSTSEVYGQVNASEVPIREDAPMRPCSPYAVSKAAQDLLSWTYFKSYGMRVIRTRMFGYLNPRREDLFASSFARQIARIELGLQKELVHGNLDSVRTLIDVRDAMESYWLALEHGVPGEVYNIGGTTAITVGEFLERLISRCRVRVPLRLDPSLLRPADVTLQIPCVDKFVALTGWRPKHSLDESIDHLLDHWRRSER